MRKTVRVFGERVMYVLGAPVRWLVLGVLNAIAFILARFVKNVTPDWAQLIPFAGSADYDFPRLQGVATNDELEMRAAIRGEVAEKIDHVLSAVRPKWTAERLRAATADIADIAHDPVRAQEIYDGDLMGFEEPQGDARVFYRWVHEELDGLLSRP